VSSVLFNNENIPYKNNVPLAKRVYESNRILAKYSSHIPVIVSYNDKLLKKEGKDKLIPKNKFLVPRDITCSQFLYTLRSQLKLHSTHAVFIFCDNKLLNGSKLMSEIYDEYMQTHGSDCDRFIYFWVLGENTFGINRSKIPFQN
jgi:hypothetical protein